MTAITLSGDALRQWQAQTGPCETCGGTEVLPDPWDAPGGAWACDCIEGRRSGPVVLVIPGDYQWRSFVAPMPWVKHNGERIELRAVDPAARFRDIASAPVLLARATLQLLPVRVDYTDYGTPAVVVMGSWMASAGKVYVVPADGSRYTDITDRFDTPPAAGRDWVALLTGVEMP